MSQLTAEEEAFLRNPRDVDIMKEELGLTTGGYVTNEDGELDAEAKQDMARHARQIKNNEVIARLLRHTGEGEDTEYYVNESHTRHEPSHNTDEARPFLASYNPQVGLTIADGVTTLPEYIDQYNAAHPLTPIDISNPKEQERFIHNYAAANFPDYRIVGKDKKKKGQTKKAYYLTGDDTKDWLREASGFLTGTPPRIDRFLPLWGNPIPGPPLRTDPTTGEEYYEPEDGTNLPVGTRIIKKDSQIPQAEKGVFLKLPEGQNLLPSGSIVGHYKGNYRHANVFKQKSNAPGGEGAYGMTTDHDVYKSSINGGETEFHWEKKPDLKMLDAYGEEGGVMRLPNDASGPSGTPLEMRRVAGFGVQGRLTNNLIDSNINPADPRGFPIVAGRDIFDGEELFLGYGGGFWGRENKPLDKADSHASRLIQWKLTRGRLAHVKKGGTTEGGGGAIVPPAAAGGGGGAKRGREGLQQVARRASQRVAGAAPEKQNVNPIPPNPR